MKFKDYLSQEYHSDFDKQYKNHKELFDAIYNGDTTSIEKYSSNLKDSVVAHLAYSLAINMALKETNEEKVSPRNDVLIKIISNLNDRDMRKHYFRQAFNSAVENKDEHLLKAIADSSQIKRVVLEENTADKAKQSIKSKAQTIFSFNKSKKTIMLNEEKKGSISIYYTKEMLEKMPKLKTILSESNKNPTAASLPQTTKPTADQSPVEIPAITKLETAIKQGDIDTVQSLLRNGNIKSDSLPNINPLYDAINSISPNRYQVIEELLRFKPDLSIGAQSPETFIILNKNDDPKLLEALFKAYDENQKNKAIANIHEIAALYENPKFFHALVNAYAAQNGVEDLILHFTIKHPQPLAIMAILSAPSLLAEDRANIFNNKFDSVRTLAEWTKQNINDPNNKEVINDYKALDKFLESQKRTDKFVDIAYEQLETFSESKYTTPIKNAYDAETSFAAKLKKNSGLAPAKKQVLKEALEKTSYVEAYQNEKMMTRDSFKAINLYNIDLTLSSSSQKDDVRKQLYTMLISEFKDALPQESKLNKITKIDETKFTQTTIVEKQISNAISEAASENPNQEKIQKSLNEAKRLAFKDVRARFKEEMAKSVISPYL